ncbi:PstS family phosphate ABC transporter substrate-binding protein [Piscibacillus halophilus]|uniref:PstS family phosphate ABC transporter substrate-binding protein n=1 Tax=Piscibacillus halophilus TaxID=571933 RepID=UPI002409CE66|nr:substrate-binding domain-containing protein [Piscibacillus halophilus]
MTFVMKIISTIILALGVAFASLMFVIYTALTVSVGRHILIFLILLVAIGIIVFWTLGIFNKINLKKLSIFAGIYFGICLLIFVGQQGYAYYLDSLEVVSNQDVDLNEYKPFVNGTKAVDLEEEATFQIEDDLPVIDGATALYPIYSSFARAVYPEADYDLHNSEVMANQTTGAYDHLLDGHADLIFAAGPSEHQENRFEEKGKTLVLTPIGREAFVFFVHPDNPVNSLTVEEIQGIYSAEITNWQELGGNDEEIRAFQRPEDSGSQTTLQKIMGDTPLMDPPTDDVVSGMGGIIEETSTYRNHKNAIGFSFRFFANEMVDHGKIKFLEIDGVAPSKASIRDDSYPFASEFYAISAGTENEHVPGFIEWILSEQGQEIIEKVGYVPVNVGD